MSYQSYSSHKKHRRRRIHYPRVIGALLLLILLGFGVFYGFSKVMAIKSKPVEEESISQEFLPRESLFVLSPKNRPTVLLQAALNWEHSIVPGSNHLGSAAKYAYDTREIRDYIRGKKQYSGDNKLVFLTFDDGVNQKISPRVLDILKKEGVPATFFILGQTVHEKNRNIIERELNEGHSIAVHSFTHSYKKLYPGRKARPDRIMEEYHQTNNALKAMLGENFDSKVFRYPGGHMSWNNIEAADAELEKINVIWIDWNALCGDGERKKVRPTTAQGMVDFTIRTANSNKNKSVLVVLMHDAENKKLTADALPQIIRYFKDQGYTFGVLK